MINCTGIRWVITSELCFFFTLAVFHANTPDLFCWKALFWMTTSKSLITTLPCLSTTTPLALQPLDRRNRPTDRLGFRPVKVERIAKKKVAHLVEDLGRMFTSRGCSRSGLFMSVSGSTCDKKKKPPKIPLYEINTTSNEHSYTLYLIEPDILLNHQSSNPSRLFSAATASSRARISALLAAAA